MEDDENDIDVNILAEQFAKEKNDIVCGFLKEKEIIEIIHKEEVNDIVAKYEQEKECMRREFELEKEDLLQGFQTQQVEKLNAFQREQENLEFKTAKEIQSRERNLEMKYKEERLKIRREYEEIIAEKNEEIKILRRELLRVQHQENRSVRHSPDNDIYITRIKSDEELRRLAEEFETEKSELERKFDRVKAQLVQDFSNQTERMNANFDYVKQRMQEDHKKELEFKVKITEKLLSEKSDLDRKRMLQQFERKITELQETLEMDFNEKLLESQQTIDNLEKDKKELLNALQSERFSLAKVYNREMSLLTKPDQLTKEDIEVALIDETAKLKKQYEDALTQMEAQHKQKIEVVKRNQRPIRELEIEHRREIEELKKDFANEKERMEGGFRKEQFNLLKSFEFEKNDLEQRYEEIINERELEIQQREDDMRRLHDDELDGLKSIVAKQREELEIAKQKLTDLADQMEEFSSEKNRIEEKFLKENNKCQNLEQALETNIRIYEKNMKEVEAFHEKELTKKADELTKEKRQLQNIETEKLDLQKEIEALKTKLEGFQMASESAIEANGEVVLEGCLVDKNAGAESEEMTRVDESNPTLTESSLDERNEEEKKKHETQRNENIEINESLRAESNKISGVDESNPTGTKNPLDESDEKREKEEENQRSKNEEVKECLLKIMERLKKCMPQGEQQLKTLEEFQMSNKQMKDAINQEIVEIDQLCGNKETREDVVLLGEEPLFSLKDQLKAVDDILTEGGREGNIDKSTQDKINENMKEVLKKAQRLHEFEKLKLKKEQQEEISMILKELADEKTVKVQESMEDLKHLQDPDKGGDQLQRCIASRATEERGTSTDDLDYSKEDQGSGRPLDMVDELRRNKEEMKRSIDDLEKSFAKEKEELMEKLQTQHKEFVMSTEGEIIENILKQKSALEEAFNLERFYLSRLYYLEMKEELEDILSRRKEKLKREFNRDKINIILKYESDIADLQKLLSEKDEMEIRLLQDRNDATGKLLATHKKGTPEKDKRKRRKEKEKLEREKENFEVVIPLKKEIADLQNKRHREHETAVANLKQAIDLIKDIMTNTPSITSVDDQQFDRLSFLSEDPTRSRMVSPVGKANESSFKPRKRDLLPEEEIRNRDELKDALENLVNLVLNEDEESVYDSETTSGASSDLEQEDLGPTTVSGDSDEGAYSGPESTDGDMLNIKKAQLDFAFNLERFNLSRVYYGEYKDSLKKAVKKLAKAKEALRSKRKDLENDMLHGIQTLVNRTHFAEELAQASKRDIETQTDTFEDRPKGFVDGLPKTKRADNNTEKLGEVDALPDDSHEDLESDQEETKEVKFQDKEKHVPETPAQSAELSIGDDSPNNRKVITKNETQEDVNAEGHSCQDDRYTEHDDKHSPVASERKLQPEKSSDSVLHGLGQDVGKIEQDEEEQKDKDRGERGEGGGEDEQEDELSRDSEDKHTNPEDDKKHSPFNYEKELQTEKSNDSELHGLEQDVGSIKKDEDEQKENERKESGGEEEDETDESSRNSEDKPSKDRHTKHDSKHSPVKNNSQLHPERVKDGVCDAPGQDLGTIEEDEGEEEVFVNFDVAHSHETNNGELQGSSEKGSVSVEASKDEDAPLREWNPQIAGEDQAGSSCVIEDHKGHETKGINENDAGKDTKEYMLETMEDLDDMEAIEVDDRISSEDRTKDEPKKDKNECAKDQSSDDKAAMESEGRAIVDIADAGDTVVIDRISFDYNTQEEPDADEKRYKKDQISDRDADKDSNRQRPAAGESCVVEDRKGDEKKGIKEKVPGKDSKEDMLEKIEDLDEMTAIEADDKTSSEDRTKEEPKKDTSKCVKDQSSDDKATMEAEESSIVESGDGSHPVDMDRRSSGAKTQERPDTDKKRYKKDESSDHDVDNDTKEDRSEDFKDVDETPRLGEKGSLKDKTEEESTEALTSADEKEIGVTIDAKPKEKKKGKKRGKKRKERKGDKYTKEGSLEESGDLSESKYKEDSAENDSFSEKSDDYLRTKDEEKDEPSFQRSESPLSEKDLIKKLNGNNKILQDKFSLLCELVGKGFVNEIPELSDDQKRKVPDAALESLSDLYEEKEQLGNELKKIDAQMKELTGSGNDNFKDLNKQLGEDEAEILQSLEEIDKHMKKNNDKELVEHLLKEKEDVCTKLDEINNILNERKHEMADLGSSDVETVPGLMYKRDVLKDDLIEKARELNYKNKLLEKTSKESEKEGEILKNSLKSLKVQLAALDDSIDNISGRYPLRVNQIGKQLPPEIKSLLASKADDERKRGELGKEMKKTEKDLERYQRMLEEKTNRLRPFQRKKARLQESLKVVNQAGIEAEELTSRNVDEVINDVKDPVEESENTGLLTGNGKDVQDEDSSLSLIKHEIKNQIKELNAAINNIELVSDDIPTAEKLEIVHQAKTNKERDLKLLEAAIIEEQTKLEKDGFDYPIQLMKYLEENEKLKTEIAKFNNSQLDMAGSKTEKGYPDVKQLQSLLLLKEGLEEKIHKLDDGISEEQTNFLEAREVKRTGNGNAGVESRIKELIDTKDKLVRDLNNTNETILQSLSTGGLTGPYAEFIEECVERKVKCEEEIDKLQDKIDDETARAAEMLEGLLERKKNTNEELTNTTETAKDELKRVQVNLCDDVEYDTDIPEEVNETISQVLLILGQESIIIPEIEELRWKQKEMEEILNEKAQKITNAYRRGQDPSDEEEALELFIREKQFVDIKLQEVLGDEEDVSMERRGVSNNTTEEVTKETRSKGKETREIHEDEDSERAPSLCTTPLPQKGDQSLQFGNLEGDLNETRRELEEKLRVNEHRLHTLMQNAGLADDLEKNGLDKLNALAVEKVKLEEELQNSLLLEDLLRKKQTLQEKLCDDLGNGDSRDRKDQIESELEKLNTLIELRENEIKKIQTKKNAKEEKVKQIGEEKEELDDTLNPLKETIIEAKEKLKYNLEEAQTNLNEYEKCAAEDRQALRQELEILQDDIERCNKEEKEVEEKLYHLKKELRETNGDVLDLERLLIEKESLREYLTEIDATLDDSERATIEQETAGEIEELKEKKKELEMELEEIRKEKEKIDIEFEQEEMDEAVKELAEMKKDLEARDSRVSDQIRGSGVLGKLAEKRKKRERKMPRDFIQGILNSMARDEKTLTELLKDQEALKKAAQRQRDNLNDMIALVKSKVGEDLFSALTSSPEEQEEIQPNKESQYRSAIDEVEGKEVTVSDILEDLGDENEQLRVINDELSSDLETLKDKIGGELATELLNQSLPIKHLEFGDVVSAVQNDDKTLESILLEQKDKLHAIEDAVGKGLFSSILENEEKPDTKSDADATTKLIAPSIMRMFDEDLENVIAVYEKELDNLSHENNVLKEKLGDDLAQELLRLSKSNEEPGKEGEDQDGGRFGVNEPLTYVQDKRKLLPLEGTSPALKIQGGLPLSSQEEGADYETIVKVTNQETDGKATDNMESQDSPKMGSSEQKNSKDDKLDRSSRSELPQDTAPINEQQREDGDHGEGTETLPRREETEIVPRLYNICSSYFSSPQEKSSSVLTDKEDFKECLNAPKIMQVRGNTLEEIIAQYERDLQISPNEMTPMTHKASDSRIRDNLSDRKKPDDISEADLTMQGIVDAQDKNMEMLCVLKERLGEDLVNALTDEIEEDHSDDMLTDGKHCDLEDEGKSESAESHMEEATFTEPGKQPSKKIVEKQMTQDSRDNLRSRKMSDALIDDQAGESVQTSHGEEEKALKRRIRAPNIALENKKTLGDVIASYENILDALQSKLGPSLTRILLAMEDSPAMEREDKLDHERTKKVKEEISDKDDAQENEKLPVGEVNGPAKELPESSKANLELLSDEGGSSIGKPLRAPDIMTASGMTLEELIEDYEQQINGELKKMEMEVNNLREKLGDDLYDTLLLNQSDRDDAVVHVREVRSSTEEMTGPSYPEASNSESVREEGEVPRDDLKAKLLLQHEGKTVEDILRSYEKQLEELSKLVPNENGESDSILDLISNYEGKIADLERTNKTFSDRMANLSECIGPYLMDKLESIETKEEDTIDGVEENDGLKVPMMMKAEDKTLEKVVRNYEKELDALRKMLPSQGDAETPISDIIKDYEDTIDDLKSRSKCLQEEHDRLVSRIGHDLVDDILALKSAEDESRDDRIDLAEIESPTKTDVSKFKDPNLLNAPIIMDKEDSTLENVLETYEKALGLLPRPQGQDDSFVDKKMHTFDELQRENKILKDALGDGLAAKLITNKDETISPVPVPSEGSEKAEKDEMKLSSHVKEYLERPKLSLRQQVKDDIPVSEDEGDQPKALAMVTDEGKTIESILKSYEKELEALRKLLPGNTNEGASVSDLVKDYEDRIEKIEKNRKTLTDMLNNLAKTIGPGLMDDLENLTANNRGNEDKDLDDDKTSDLAAPNLMHAENRTLEGVVRIYENEINALRKLVPGQGDEASSVSDVIKDYEDKLEELAEENKHVKCELRELRDKIGNSLVDDLTKSELTKAEGNESLGEASEKGNNLAMKKTVKLKAPDLMNEKKLRLEDILVVYEDDLCNLKRVNKIYEEGIGQGIADALLKFAEEIESSSPEEIKNQESSAELSERIDDEVMKQSENTLGTTAENNERLKQPSQTDATDEAKPGLKAVDLLREEGNDLVKILESYEKEIEALKKIAPGEGEEGISVSDLIRDYEDRTKDLEGKQTMSVDKLNNLEKRIGEDLFDALEKLRSNEKQPDGEDSLRDNECDLNAVHVMTNEDRTLENVIKNYEKELSALRKLLSGQEDESSSLSDIIKEYEDQIEEIERQNEDLKSDLNALEGNLGSSLFDNLKRACNEKSNRGPEGSERNEDDSPVLEKLRAPEIMNENDLTLEKVIASYERDLDSLAKENKVLKASLGQRLVKTVLNTGDKKEISALTDYDDHSYAGGVGKELMPLPPLRKGITNGSEKQIVVADSTEDATQINNQLLDRNNNDEVETSTAICPDVLKAESLITDEGRAIENILKNYEKQLEALAKLAPGNERGFISELVTNYEDVIGGLEKENSNLVRRLENLENKIGRKLLNEVENREPQEATPMQENSDQDDDGCLMAPKIMEKEERTLQNVVKTYEKELDVLRNLIPSEDGEGSTITDIVITYEDKIDQLKTENESLRDDAERLKNRIGHDLVNDINKLEEISFAETESEELGTRKPVKDLKVTKIMDVKRSTLEDVLETYESALGTLLSDASSSTDEFNCDMFYDQSSAIRELKEENDILKSTVGPALSQTLISIAKDGTESNLDDIEDEEQVVEQDTAADDEPASIKGLEKALQNQTGARDDNEEENVTPKEALKAANLVREEGRTIENILENYEKELEAIKSIAPNGSYNLGRKYEDEKDELEKKNKSLAGRIDFLEEKIGADLMNDLENKHGNKETLESSTISELIAPVIMEEEDRTLETVIKFYEKELDALRKLAMNQQEHGEFSISGIIKEYESRLDGLKDETKSLKNDLDRLANRLGNNLVEDIKRLDDETVDGDQFSDGYKYEVEYTGMKKHLKAPKIMREKMATLEDILKRYEDALELNFSETGFPYEKEDIEKASDDPLKSMKDIKKENEILKNALGENLTQSILEAATVNKSEDDLEHDTSMQTVDGTNRGERKPALTDRSQDNDSSMLRSEDNTIAGAVFKPSPSDGLKANALMKNERTTVENILKNYEKEIEALSKLISQDTDPGYSISDLVTSYEDKIDDLKVENRDLENRLETLTENLGKDLEKVLESGNLRKEGDGDLLQLKESTSLSNPRWKAVETMKEDEKTLEDVLELYERDLERLHREKGAMEVLVNTNESDGQSALDIISQYEDEIEQLKDTAKERENKLSILFARIGDNLVSDILSLTPGKKHPSCSLQALQIMAMHEKELSAVLEQYEDDLSKLTRENEALKTIASKEEVDGKQVTSVVSEYEKKIQELLEEKKEVESSLCVLTKKTGESLAKEMLNPDERDKTFSLDALKIMDDETKTLADVVEKYEDDLAKMYRELKTLRDLASDDPETISALDKISKYEDEISNLTNTIKKHALLEKKVGEDLSKQLTGMDEKGTEDSKGIVIFSLQAVSLLEKNKDATVASVLKDYEDELEKKNREILTLKELISGDMLEIAASQESEIYELKKVKGVLANELDLISDKVGKELVNELLKNSTQPPTTETGKLYREVAQRMEIEGMPLERVVEDYDKEIKLILGKNKELSEKEDVLTEKVGKDLVNEILRKDAYKSTKSESKPLFEASKLMSTEAKTLAEVVLSYEKELAKLKRENEALRLLTDKESSQDSSVIDVLSDYEGQIEKLEAENREFSKRLQKITERVGKELTEELLKLPDEVCKDKIETINELNALKILKENQATLTDILQDYEKKLREDDEPDFGRLVSGKFAQLVRLDESEPEIVISREEPSDISVYLHESTFNLTPDGNAVNRNPLDDQALADTNAKLRMKLEQLLRKVGKELSQELMRSAEDKEEEITSAVKFASVRDLEAFDDVVSDRATLAQVLESYEKKLKRTIQDDVGPFKAPEDDSDRLEEEEKGNLTKELDSQSTQTKAESNERDKTEALEEKIKKLEKALEQEKTLKEKYEKDVQDLLKDIVDLKMKQVESDTENPEELKRKIQEEVDLKQDNKRLQEDLANERKRSVSIEESKRDLLDKVDALMREKEMLLKQQNEPQLVRGNEGVNEICEIEDTEILSHYNVPESDLNRNEKEEVDGRTVLDMNDLDLTCLENLIPENYQIIEHPKESLLTCPDRELVKEETIKVELPKHEECFNPEFLENLFASDIAEDMSTVPDSKSRETEAESGEREKRETLEKRVRELERELEEEKSLKEKYDKDIQDLLKDIVDVKMKKVEDDAENPEEARRKIQEEVELIQEKKRLQEDLSKERKRRLSIEESKRDLLEEVDALMREKEMLLKQQNEPKGDEKLLEDMINLRKKIGELDTRNKNLNREVKELRQSIKELEICHDEEKSQLLDNCEKEKSEMRNELVTSKRELETQLQELLGMNDDLKGTIKNLLEELKESHEKLVSEGEKQDRKESDDPEKNEGDEARQLVDETQDKERNAAYEREKTENLKEQLDETENALRQTLKKYQEEITALETEKAKREDELRQEIKILSNKLELEKVSAEQQKKDFENVFQREKERLKEDMAMELEREKRKMERAFEDREDELARQGKKCSADLQEQEEQWNKEREGMQEIFLMEKEKLQKAFDEEVARKVAEKDEQHRQRNEQMNREFAKEKMEIIAAIEKKIYEQLIDKNISAETDFQEVLSKILQEHSKEIEGVENDIRKAEERFMEDKNRLIDQSDKEKKALKKAHEEEKKALELTVQNLLKEVVKLKHQRKEIRIIHKKEKESMEEIYERDRVKLKDDWEQYKRDLLSKLQDEFDNKLSNEATKLETRLEDVKRELEKSEQKRKELEERLRGIPHEIEKQRFDEGDFVDKTNIDKEEHLNELKSVKKKLEEEYEKKLKEEKRKFEETLQGLRREIGSLQEKRRFIQEKLYNHDPSVADKHLMEKSLANYKMEMLSKMEEEVAHKIAREKKPLEESITELQLENDELKRQRWELRNQLRRERSKLEEEFERERENMESQFLKEKEELKNRLESRIQREMNKRTVEDKVNRAESPYSSQDSPRRLRSENTTLRDDNDRLELEVRHLTNKLETLETSFQEIISSEKLKVEKMKRIQAKMPKKQVTFSDDVETRTMVYTTGDHNETVLHELRERDSQVRELMEAKHFYEGVLSELCEEAGLFELDQNVVI